MTAVNEIKAAQDAISLYTEKGNGSVLGKEDFLQLLISQLQNQDPLNPSDPTEFTAQLAQFSSLEQLFSVNENLGRMVDKGNGMDQLSALSLINNSVVAEADRFNYTGQPVELGYRLEEAATDVKLFVKDLAGRTVSVHELGEKQAGNHFLSWNGTDALGNTVAAGEYTISVSARFGEETNVTAHPLLQGVVSGVDLDATEYRLITEVGEFSLPEIISVRRMQKDG